MELSKLSDVSIIAATLCQEAGGEDYAGIVMVAQVIKNRSIQSGKSLREVCLEPKQFSAWNNKGEMWLRMQTIKGHPAWKVCVEIATEIFTPGYKPVSPVTHYFNPSKASPSWAKRMRLVAIVGAHNFYREKGTP